MSNTGHPTWDFFHYFSAIEACSYPYQNYDMKGINIVTLTRQMLIGCIDICVTIYCVMHHDHNMQPASVKHFLALQIPVHL